MIAKIEMAFQATANTWQQIPQPTQSSFQVKMLALFLLHLVLNNCGDII